MYINMIHHKKIHPIIPLTTLVLKYIFKISNSMMGIILSWIYSICSNSSTFVGFFTLYILDFFVCRKCQNEKKTQKKMFYNNIPII